MNKKHTTQASQGQRSQQLLNAPLTQLSNMQKLRLSQNAAVLGLNLNLSKVNQQNYRKSERQQQPGSAAGNRLFSPQLLSSNKRFVHPAVPRKTQASNPRDTFSPQPSSSKPNAVHKKLMASTLRDSNLFGSVVSASSKNIK